MSENLETGYHILTLPNTKTPLYVWDVPFDEVRNSPTTQKAQIVNDDAEAEVVLTPEPQPSEVIVVNGNRVTQPFTQRFLAINCKGTVKVLERPLVIELNWLLCDSSQKPGQNFSCFSNGTSTPVHLIPVTLFKLDKSTYGNRNMFANNVLVLSAWVESVEKYHGANSVAKAVLVESYDWVSDEHGVPCAIGAFLVMR